MKLQTISPVDGSVYVERQLAGADEVAAILAAARRAQQRWRQVPIAERAALCTQFVDAFVSRKQQIAE